MRQTIFGLASGAGRCGVAVIRISGPRSAAVYEQLTCRPASALQPRLLHTVDLYSGPRDGNALLDKAMAVFFAGPRSFTGEDVLELHVHGAPAVIDAVYGLLHDSIRLARPGEFTERAFHSGKLGLREVEGLADLLAAETASQRKQALWLLGGGGEGVLAGWRLQIIGCLAKMEAFIDFSEDENIESAVVDEAEAEVSVLIRDLGSELSRKSGESIRTGYKVAICGRPNAGKSSLFNALVGRKAAIVSALPGTTRDVLQVNLDIRGLPIVLLDTAGVRDGVADEVEAEGVARAKEAAHSADLVVQLIDPGDRDIGDIGDAGGDEGDLGCAENVLKVYNKSDLYGAPVGDAIRISCKSKHGIEALTDLIHKRLTAQAGASCSEAPLITRSRHRRHLQDCLGRLQEFVSTRDAVLRTEALRQAAQDLGRVSGAVDSEDVLDALFRSFCIGK